MSIIKLIMTVSLAVALVTMITSNQPSVYASPTTEDDGWTEGDYEGSPEEQEDQAQEDWEDAGPPGDDDDDDDDDDDEDPYAGLPTPEEAGETGVVDCGNGVFVNPRDPCPQDEEEPVLVLCSDGQTQVEEDRVEEDCPETNQASATGLPLCDGTFQDCVTGNGDVCIAGSTAHECELPEPTSRELPNKDCLFNTELPKCAPVDGKCPDGFGTNEDGRCFVIHDKCPDGYHTTEDDETGECNPNSECTGEGYVLVNNGQSCREKKTWCLEKRGADECNQKSPIKKNKDTNKVIQKTTVIDRSSASASATATTTVNAAEVSTCKLNGNTDGLQQKFDSIKHRACGLYPNGQIAYTDGFVVGCTQAGNTQQLCQAFVIMNTQQTQTAATQPNMQSTTQPTQAIQPSGVS
jgi:hypothetical protein